MPPSPVTQEAPHKRVLYSAGEGIHLVDINNMQTFQMARIGDLYAPLYDFLGDDPTLLVDTPADTLCLVPRAGAAFPYRSATGLEVNVERGWIFQKNPSGGTGPNGEHAVCLGAFIPKTTPLFTLSTADPANPRYDLIQVKLSEIDDDSVTRDFEDAVTRAKTSSATNTSRRVQVDWSVKEGTAAANPTPPSPDSGYAEYARIYVPASATNLATDNIFDMRMPMRVEAQRIPPYAIGRPGASPWSIDTGQTISIQNNSLAGECYAFPNAGDQCARILGWWANADPGAGTSILIGELARYDDNDGTLSFQSLDQRNIDSSAYNSSWFQFAGMKTGTYTANEWDHRPIWTNYFGPGERKADGYASSPVTGEGGFYIAHNSFYRIGLKLYTAVAELVRVWEAGFFVATDV